MLFNYIFPSFFEGGGGGRGRILIFFLIFVILNVKNRTYKLFRFVLKLNIKGQIEVQQAQ